MTTELSRWRTSSYSGPQGNCVEIGYGAAAVGVRDTKDRDGGTIALSSAQWANFLRAVNHDRYER